MCINILCMDRVHRGYVSTATRVICVCISRSGVSIFFLKTIFTLDKIKIIYPTHCVYSKTRCSGRIGFFDIRQFNQIQRNFGSGFDPKTSDADSIGRSDWLGSMEKRMRFKRRPYSLAERNIIAFRGLSIARRVMKPADFV